MEDLLIYGSRILLVLALAIYFYNKGYRDAERDNGCD